MIVFASPARTAVLAIVIAAASAHAQSRPAPGTIDGVVTDTNLVSLNDATALDTVVIPGKRLSPRMTQFEERRKLGFGQFMTQAQIEKRNAVVTTDFLRTFLAVGVGAGRAFNLRGGAPRTCYFQVFIDDGAVPTPNFDDLCPSCSPGSKCTRAWEQSRCSTRLPVAGFAE